MLRPPPQLTVSAWADQHRVLSTRASSEPGPWRTSRTPYLRDILDALSAVHPARRVVFMKGAQVGASEGGNCWLGYIMHHVPAPVLAVQPTVELAKRFSRQRIDPLLEETPALRARVAPARSRDAGNTMLSKEFPGGILVLTGANSAVGLRSMTARFLFLDEVDAYPGDVEGEGDPIALAEARARTFGWRRKAFLVSTPTIAGRSRIEREYQTSDQRRFFLPCPYCQATQWLRFERLIWDKGNPQSVAYHCEACDQPIGEHHKTAMLAAGDWRATAEAEDPHTIGFHISALYSPVGWLSWEQIARDWETAQGKPEDLKTFRNTVLGETWQDRGEAPDWERLVERREAFGLGTVPSGALVLTAGVDVQDDRIECDVWGWTEGFTSWLIDHVVIDGSPRERAPWEALARLLARDWLRPGEACPRFRPAKPDGMAGRGGPASGAMRIAKICVDTGGRDTASVYGHLRHLRDPRIAPTKGVEGWNRAQPVQGPTLVDALVNGQKLRRGLKLWTVSVSTWKADLYRRLWLGRGDADADAGTFPAGWVHLPSGIEVEWVKQLVAEQLRTSKDRRGFARQEWVKLRERNEALDCAVLARAALWLLGADRYGDRYWQRLRTEAEDAGLVVPAAAEVGTTADTPDLPATPNTAIPNGETLRPRAWLGSRGGWLR
jgi:phage terminase large subunit GpA-like protein